MIFFWLDHVYSTALPPLPVMRLTAELINTSLSYLNTLKERELDLRGKLLASPVPEKNRYYTPKS